MPTSSTPARVAFQDSREVDAAWLVVPVFEDEPEAAAGPLAAWVARGRAGGFTGKRFESLILSAVPGVRAKNLLLLGAGPAGEYQREVCRRVAAAAAIFARGHGGGTVAILPRAPGGAGPEAWAGALAEGFVLGGFDPGRYKTQPHNGQPADLVILAGPGDASGVETGVRRAEVVADCVNLARELVNEPANRLPPRVLAARAREAADGTALRVEVLEPPGIADLGMGLLLGVAQGSQEPARLIALEHHPAGAPPSPVLGLVGKGVTFDSGGISIKPAANMDRMKDDMAGAAAVIASLRAVARLGVPLRVIGVVPSVENMPSGSAIRPGDVLRGASGRTVEVTDTDAEGRLILGDALWYARRLGATHLVDIATLTGACAVALGKTTTGLFGRPDGWVDAVRRAADESGDRCWPMPVFDDYSELLKSDIADTLNVGGRYAGAITAALFVGEFAAGLPWAHLDIAGTAWNDESKPYAVKGPTGVGVRALTALAAAMSRGLAGA